jgi:catechol 2,3-dioxygenase-like lactoylglutathione lyase family enzyme
MSTDVDTTTDRNSVSSESAPMTRAPGIPSSHHHLAYSTHDTRATIDFYTRVLGMPLVEAVLDDRLPSTGAPYPYLHTFFRMEDGTCIAFFESPGVPKMAPIEHQALKIFNHLAMEVPTRHDVDRWAQWLKANGVEVTVVDHGIIYSVYFHDPVNGIRLELTATLDPTWNDKPVEAGEAVEQWYATHREAERTGADVRQALRDLALSRSNQAKVKAGKHD